MNMPGVFTISLDFELFWGVRDHRTISSYGNRILGVQKAIPAMLSVFNQFGIHATWATVGLLFFDTKQDQQQCFPKILPSYVQGKLSPYIHYDAEVGRSESEDAYHFGLTLLQEIQATPNQEIATHTFGHIYLLEAGMTDAAFEADIVAAKAAAQRLGITLHSIVFPRNQFTPAHVAICLKHEIVVYRGNPAHGLYAPRSRNAERMWLRAFRLLDAHVPLTGHNTHALSNMDGNVPASRFLRPYKPGLASLDALQLQRICNSMSYAAKNGRLFHLWWHPHNFGMHLPQNIQKLEAICKHFAYLSRTFGMRSLTMHEVYREYHG